MDPSFVVVVGAAAADDGIVGGLGDAVVGGDGSVVAVDFGGLEGLPLPLLGLPQPLCWPAIGHFHLRMRDQLGGWLMVER